MRYLILLFLALAVSVSAQVAPYDKPLPVGPPYYRVRYEASTKPGELVYPVNYTIWIPPGLKTDLDSEGRCDAPRRGRSSAWLW